MIANLDSGVEAVGLVREPRTHYLYLATGHRWLWQAGDAVGATVFRSAPGSNAWSSVGDGLPAGLPITGLGVGRDTGLFLSTYGRGVWWRRDAQTIPDFQ